MLNAIVIILPYEKVIQMSRVEALFGNKHCFDVQLFLAPLIKLQMELAGSPAGRFKQKAKLDTWI